MSTKSDKQFICTLHTHHECPYQRSYHRDCGVVYIEKNNKYPHIVLGPQHVETIRIQES